MKQENCWLKDTCNKIDCNSFCLKFYKLNYIYNLSLLNDNQRNKLKLRLDSDGSDKKAFDTLKKIEIDIVDFVNNGKNLFIYSDQVGNGKTSWSVRLLQSYLNRNWTHLSLSCHILFISVPKFLLSIKDNITEKNEYVEHIKNNIDKADLVVFDDIGSKQSTVFEDSNLLSMIDNRINNNKANIFTSNLSNELLHDALGDRLYSRVFNSSIKVELVGADKRSLMINNKGVIE